MAELLGVLVISRHGDRQGFYQNPLTYTAAKTNLTVLGYLQEWQNGDDLRNFYLLNDTDPIQGINTTQSEYTQLNVLADAGGEGGVIVESANALLQGLFPPYNDSLLLANGTTVTWPTSRSQLFQIETITPDYEPWLEGYSDCTAWTNWLADWYNSTEFQSNATIADAFYQNISSILGDRPLTLQNGYNIYDFMNVQYIHNTTLSPEIAPYLAEAQYWGNYHEANSFASSNPTDIQNIAGQSFLPPFLAGLQTLANTTSGVKIEYLAASYKPFLGLFSLMGLGAPFTTTMVNYASIATFEVWSDDSVIFRFRNGTDGDFVQYDTYGNEGSTPLSTYVNQLSPYSLDSRAAWCNKCGNTENYGCDVLASFNGTGGGAVEYAPITSTTGRHHVSPVVAGVIGAMTTLAVVALALAGFLIFAALFKRSRRNKSGAKGAGAKAPGSSGFELAGGSPSHEYGSEDGTRASDRDDGSK